MCTDRTQAAQQVHAGRQKWPEHILHTQPVLQYHHLAIGCCDLSDERRQLPVAGAFSPHQ